MDEDAFNPYKSKIKFRENRTESADLKNGYYQSKDSNSDLAYDEVESEFHESRGIRK